MTRIERLRKVLDQEGKYPYFITDLSNIFYLSGFTGSTAYIILTENDNLFLTDGRYEIQSKEEVVNFDIKIVEDYKNAVLQVVGNGKKVYVEPECLLQFYILFTKNGIMVESLEENPVKRLRMKKDERELKLIEKSYEIAEKSFLELMENASFDKKEKEWAAFLEYRMKLNGAEKNSFDTIVASGFRGALAHGIASDKIVQKNEPVIVDFGCKKFYCSDITRLVYNGNDRFVLKIADIVRSALLKAIDAIKPGVKCCDVDKVARDYIEKKGYGMFFNHGLGHGVGIDVHELPSFNKKDETVLEPDMVLTVEPGIYFENEFGVRLEDTIVVTNDGCKRMNKLLDKYIYKIK